MSDKPMNSAKPYLIRAIYEWITDNSCTPYINVDTTVAKVMVPKEYIKDNSITLDISMEATNKLYINNEAISFQAGFGAKNHNVYIPIVSVRAIFAPENNQGMAFPEEEFPEEEPVSAATSPVSNKDRTSPFKVIKGGKNQE